MRRIKRFLVFWRSRVEMAAVLIVCLLASTIYLSSAQRNEMHLSELEFATMGIVERQAWQLTEEVIEAGIDVKEQFAAELLALYYEAKDCGFVVFCSSGGWGKKTLASDCQGRSWLTGIEAKLTELGYTYCIVDGIRTGDGLKEYLFEFKEHLAHYPSKAEQMAAKIDFLTQQIADIKILITGQSNGAAFASEVAEQLEDNPEVYSIQVGCPFWYEAPEVSRSLVIDSGGVEVDALARSDIVTLLKANWLKLFIIGHAPSFTPFDWLVTKAFLIFGLQDYNLGLEAPGHEYMWEYPGVGPVIGTFLVENFGME